MPQRKCTAITRAGNRCRGPALPDDDKCFTHSPAVASKRAERNQRGGQNKSNETRALKVWVAAGEQIRPEDLPHLLLGMTEAVANGELEPARASAISQLIRTSLSVAVHLGWEKRLLMLERTLGRIERVQPSAPQPQGQG